MPLSFSAFCDTINERKRNLQRNLSLTVSGGGKMEHKAKSVDPHDPNRDVMYQVSLLQGLTYGDYCGSVTVKELKQHGDIGIGTFDGLNGELIMLNGEAYRAAGDGNVELVSDRVTVPFSVVTFMDADERKRGLLPTLLLSLRFCNQIPSLILPSSVLLPQVFCAFSPERGANLWTQCLLHESLRSLRDFHRLSCPKMHPSFFRSMEETARLF